MKKTEAGALDCLCCEYIRKISKWTAYCPFFSCMKEPPPRPAPGSG